jgi:monomeric sarcosine oxidase
MSKSYDTVVVGAGVFGAWTAWHLLRAGQKVLLVDKYGPANARASSGGETRVIRTAYGPNEIYTRMSQQSLVMWKEFFARIERPELFRQTGVLWLAEAGDPAVTQSAAVLSRLGVNHEMLDASTLARRYPQIVVPPSGWAILEPDSGALLARRAVQALVDDNLDAGAELRIASVIAPQGDGHLAEVRTESGEDIRADRFVFACGPWLGSVLSDVLGGRIFPTRQEVFYFGAAPGDCRFASPALPIWLDFGRDYYGIPDVEGRGFKIAHDLHGAAIDPDTMERSPSPARIAHAREFLARRFPALANAPLLGAEVCQYENTSNGDFVIDSHPGFDNVWITGGGSGHGFKHGPAVGAYLVQRMLHDGPVEPRFSLATKQTQQRREVH